jgi:hypothetical protein
LRAVTVAAQPFGPDPDIFYILINVVIWPGLSLFHYQ